MHAALWRNAIVAYFIHCVSSQDSAVLYLSSNEVYSGDQVTLSCRYGYGFVLAFVSMEAYNATSKVGFLWCSTASVNTTGVGVFTGQVFSGCPAFSVGATSVSVTMTATPAHQLDYNCSARVVNTNGDAVTVKSLTSSLAVLPAKAMPCGSLIRGFGLLRSVNYPNYYFNNYRCSWTLQASPSSGMIKLEFLRFSTETCCDFVTILNGSGTQFSYSGTSLPPSLTLGNLATVIFTTDSSSVREGFAIEVSTIAQSLDCGGVIIGFGQLQSLNYPSVYNNSISCTWVLQASPANGVIHLDFITFLTETYTDVVRIYSQSGALLFSYSGTLLPTSVTLGRQATVTFITDYSVVYTGFSILVSTIVPKFLACGSLVSGFGILQSVNYPYLYGNGHSCPWSLLASPKNGVIRLEFLNFSTEPNYDFVNIYNESGAVLFSYSGNIVPPILTLGSAATVIFTTDQSSTYSGFSIVMSTIGSEYVACGSLVNGSGMLQSPLYPKSYTNGHNCSWGLEASPGGIIYLEFLTFATELCCDFVKVYNSSGSLMFSYSGTTVPSSLTLGHQATVMFTTDSSIVNSGFSIMMSTTGSASITFSSNPVYIGEPVTVTCSYGTKATLVMLTLEVINGANNIGYLWCSVPHNSIIGDGVLTQKSFIGCPVRTVYSENASISINASLSLSFYYRCSAVVSCSNGERTSIKSLDTFLDVRVLPSTPTLWPTPITFNESADDATITCHAFYGRPEAEIILTIRTLSGKEASANGSLLTLPLPLKDWHNSVATCAVSNHNFANMTVSSLVTVNHIACIGIPPDINTVASSATLDCSRYVIAYPGVYYTWSVPPVMKFENGSQLSGATIIVLRGQTGMINCTATNNSTLDSVVVHFNTSSWEFFSTSSSDIHSSCGLCWVIGPVMGSVVVFAVISGLLWKRRRFLNRKPSESPSREVKVGTESSERCNVTNEPRKSVDERCVSSFNTLQTSESIYEQYSKEQNLSDVDAYEMLSL